MQMGKSPEYNKYLKRLREIEEKTSELKSERAYLLKARAWYAKPTTWLGIFAIAVPIFLFGLNYFLFQRKTELTVMIGETRPLVLFSPSVKPKTEIKYDGTSVDNISRRTIRLENTGTESIDRSGFKDGPLRFILSERSSGSAQNSAHVNIPLILDVFRTAVAGQQNDSLEIISYADPAEFTYIPSLLNPGEFVEIEVYLSQQKISDLNCQGKIANGNVLISFTDDVDSPNSGAKPTLMLGRSIIYLVGSKWMALALLAFFLIAVAVMDLGLFAFAYENDWEWEYVVFFTTGIIITAALIAITAATALSGIV